ncbi:3'-5' exonuclease [Azoarcus sp. L1K30]|uniref:3'-5' exonuclease n=1 Tax=Azoarcus sp. L1K30 TaxID=2820277 RepID=UPI001B81E831|nr:3'-5' exonuclease [Azoarcus sp. L1K30]MBR0566743.1 3'-5' exonuclease [Azoarcus sp. L1K30]
MSTYAVIDFETTGMAPEHGCRPTEIAAVLVRDGLIVDRYQSLMNAGAFVPHEIQALTGITNAMVRTAPRVEQVMTEVADFVGDHAIVAHNAAFDRKFWDAELARLGRQRTGDFVCSLLLSRRLFPDVPNHRLATLVHALNLPATGRYHRALADAEATAHLFIRLRHELQGRFRLPAVEHDLLLAVQKTARSGLARCVERFRDG